MDKYIFLSPGILERIVIPCTIDVSDYETEEPEQKCKLEVKALWDTGSTVTVLSEMLVQRLGLLPSDVQGFLVGMEILSKPIHTQ